MSLREYHGYASDGVRWRLVPAGVEVEGGGVERTRGAPSTATRVWDSFARAINASASSYRVPCALIVATICTESSGRADAVRQEPGYVSDEQTPHKVSAGLMQTLLSTATQSLQMSLNRDWLLVPANSIQAGTAYIAQQFRLTTFDPPLVAAAYNAGNLYHQPGVRNRWKLHQYPIGTGEHVDRFVRFFNDAMVVLSTSAASPSVGMEAVLEGVCEPQPRGNRTPTRGPVEIAFGTNADANALTPYSREVLEALLRASGHRRALISSTSRNPTDQARVMYDNLERHGIAHQKELYGRGGDAVIDVYAKSKKAGKDPSRIKADMEQKIRELGPTNVSRHAADPSVLNVFDVAPSSLSNQRGFEQAVRGDARVKTFLVPPKDPGYHLEIPQPQK